MSHLPSQLLETTSTLTRVCRLDGLACPPVPPNTFHLRLVLYRLQEIERALRLERLYVLPKNDSQLLSERIYDLSVRIHWCICGRPPPRETSLLHAADDCLQRVIGALTP